MYEHIYFSLIESHVAMAEPNNLLDFLLAPHLDLLQYHGRLHLKQMPSESFPDSRVKEVISCKLQRMAPYTGQNLP